MKVIGSLFYYPEDIVMRTNGSHFEELERIWAINMKAGSDSGGNM